MYVIIHILFLQASLKDPDDDPQLQYKDQLLDKTATNTEVSPPSFVLH